MDGGSLWFTICAWAMWADCSSWYLKCGRKCGWGLALVHHMRLGHVGGLQLVIPGLEWE